MNTSIAYTTLTFNMHNNILLDKQEYVTIRKYSADVMNRTSTGPPPLSLYGKP